MNLPTKTITYLEIQTKGRPRVDTGQELVVDDDGNEYLRVTAEYHIEITLADLADQLEVSESPASVKGHPAIAALYIAAGKIYLMGQRAYMDTRIAARVSDGRNYPIEAETVLYVRFATDRPGKLRDEANALEGLIRYLAETN